MIYGVKVKLNNIFGEVVTLNYTGNLTSENPEEYSIGGSIINS
nr:MAG TPA: hypothetical protein [Crassvirales sp.]